jgi:predicted nucleotidyltransferase
MQNNFLSEHLNLVQNLMRKHRIKKGYLFGSFAKGNLKIHSDLDVLVEVDETIDPVELGEHLWNLQIEMEALVGRKVDLLTTRSLRNPFFIQEINETRQLIYG